MPGAIKGIKKQTHCLRTLFDCRFFVCVCVCKRNVSMSWLGPYVIATQNE